MAKERRTKTAGPEKPPPRRSVREEAPAGRVRRRAEPREVLEIRLAEQVQEMGAEIGILRTQVDESDWEPDMDYRRSVDELELRYRDLQGRILGLKTTSDAAWWDVHAEIEDELYELGNALKRTQDLLADILLE